MSFKSACPSNCLDGTATGFVNIGIESCNANSCICKAGYNMTTNCESCDLGYVDVDSSAIVDCQSNIFLGNFYTNFILLEYLK